MPHSVSIALPSDSVPTGRINLLRLPKVDRKSDNFTASLRDTLYSEDYSKSIESLTDDEIHKFVDFLDQSLDTIPSNSEVFHKCLRALRKLCGRTGQLPSSYKISETNLVREGYHPVASGGFSDLWTGTFGQSKVALRYWKMSVGESVKARKALYKEAVVWKRLSHPNVLPLLGVSNMHSLPCIVSAWMPYGSIIDYLMTHPKENRLGLLSDVAEGLNYLHSFRVVHGDLKGANILIDDLGNVRLADFGLNSIVIEDSHNASPINNERGTPRWMAPEILNVEGLNTTRPSKESDVYAFAMVVVEVFTCRPPFPELGHAAVLIRVVGGERPPRPEEACRLGLSDSVWEMVEKCWEQEPLPRPKISEVLKFFKEAATAHAQQCSVVSS